jgi:hypothetical protein
MRDMNLHRFRFGLPKAMSAMTETGYGRKTGDPFEGDAVRVARPAA